MNFLLSTVTTNKLTTDDDDDNDDVVFIPLSVTELLASPWGRLWKLDTGNKHSDARLRGLLQPVERRTLEQLTILDRLNDLVPVACMRGTNTKCLYHGYSFSVACKYRDSRLNFISPVVTTFKPWARPTPDDVSIGKYRTFCVEGLLFKQEQNNVLCWKLENNIVLLFISLWVTASSQKSNESGERSGGNITQSGWCVCRPCHTNTPCHHFVAAIDHTWERSYFFFSKVIGSRTKSGTESYSRLEP